MPKACDAALGAIVGAVVDAGVQVAINAALDRPLHEGLGKAALGGAIGGAAGGVLGGIAKAARAGDRLGDAVSLGAAVTRAERGAAIDAIRGSAPLFRDFFATGKVPEGLTRELMEAYKVTARYSAQHADTMDKSREQLRRIRQIDDALKR